MRTSIINFFYQETGLDWSFIFATPIFSVHDKASRFSEVSITSTTKNIKKATLSTITFVTGLKSQESQVLQSILCKGERQSLETRTHRKQSQDAWIAKTWRNKHTVAEIHALNDKNDMPICWRDKPCDAPFCNNVVVLSHRCTTDLWKVPTAKQQEISTDDDDDDDNDHDDDPDPDHKEWNNIWWWW